MSDGTDHYFRLITFVVEGCPQPHRELFLQKAKSDNRTGVPYTNLENFLQCHQAIILQKKTRIRKDQLDLIYPKQGQPVDCGQWDITLISTLLKEIFNPLTQDEKKYIDDIRDVRNELHHMAGTAEINDMEFKQKWKKLDTATYGLTKCVNQPIFHTHMRAYIDDLKHKPLPPPGPALDVFKQWYAVNMEMREDICDIQETVRATENQLKDVVDTTQTPSGAVLKRIKTVDPILVSMKDQFKKTLEQKLPDDFLQPPETPDIQESLRDRHIVVVSGHNQSRQLETALSAIKDMPYDNKRCVQINEASEWRHVTREDVDFVLFLEPFGIDEFDREKSNAMIDVFNSVMAATRINDEDGRIDVILVTEYSILQECRKDHDHELLNHVVMIQKSTTETEPVNLTNDKKRRCSVTVDPVFINLLEQTKVEIDHYHHRSFKNEQLLRDAQEMLKKHKKITIAGPQRSGKTTLAVKLLSAYQPNECLLLMYPAQWQHVKLGKISVLWIEDFPSKYKLDIGKAADWFAVFDRILTAVKERKLSVIITCDNTSLEKCVVEINSHELLEQKVTLAAEDAPTPEVKSEAGTSNQEETPASGDEHHVYSATRVGEFDIKFNDAKTCDIRGLCMLPDGKLLLADYKNKKLKRFDSNYKVVDSCSLTQPALSVCSISETEAAVAVESAIQFVSLGQRMKITRSVNVKNTFHCIAYGGGKLYCTSKNNKVHVYSIAGEFVRRIPLECENSTFCRHIAVINNGERLYVANSTSKLTCFDNSGKTIWEYDHRYRAELTGLCVDRENNVLLCGKNLDAVLVSPEGQNLGSIKNLTRSSSNYQRLCYDAELSRLIFSKRSSDVIDVYDLK